MCINKWIVRAVMLVFGIGLLVAAGMMVKNFQVREFEDRGRLPEPVNIKLPVDNPYA